MSKKKTIILVIVIAAFFFGAGFIYEHLNYVSTDNASIQAHALMIAPKVGGIVTKVLVEENQSVKKDQVLFEIDSRDYVNTYNQVKAHRLSGNSLIRMAHRISLRDLCNIPFLPSNKMSIYFNPQQGSL